MSDDKLAKIFYYPAILMGSPGRLIARFVDYNMAAEGADMDELTDAAKRLLRSQIASDIEANGVAKEPSPLREGLLAIPYIPSMARTLPTA